MPATHWRVRIIWTSAFSSQRKYQPKALGMEGGWREKANAWREQEGFCTHSLSWQKQRKNIHHTTIPIWKKIYSEATKTAYLHYRQPEPAGSACSIRHDLFSFVSSWCPSAATGRGRCRESPANPRTVDAWEKLLPMLLGKPKPVDCPIQESSLLQVLPVPGALTNNEEGLMKLFRSGLGNQMEKSLLWGNSSGLQLIFHSTDPKQPTSSHLLWNPLASHT